MNCLLSPTTRKKKLFFFLFWRATCLVLCLISCTFSFLLHNLFTGQCKFYHNLVNYSFLKHSFNHCFPRRARFYVWRIWKKKIVWRSQQQIIIEQSLFWQQLWNRYLDLRLRSETIRLPQLYLCVDAFKTFLAGNLWHRVNSSNLNTSKELFSHSSDLKERLKNE